MRIWRHLLFILFLIPFATFAQSNTIVTMESWEYHQIKQLQLRGYLLNLNPSSLPYTRGEIYKELNDINSDELSGQERDWYDALVEAVEPRKDNVGEFRVGGSITSGARRSSSARLNVINPAGKAKPVLPRTELKAYMEWDNFVGQAGATFDWFYDVDPVGLDLGRRLYMRSEDAYFGYKSNYFDLYVGRYSNHWSVFNQQGAFLTDNPRSFDHLNLRFGNNTISFSSILGELDNLGPNGNFTGIGFQPGSIRRYIFLHRLDWSIKPNLKLTFMEGELYHSETAGIQFRNLMPLHFLFFESHNSPMNNNSNLIIGGSIWYQLGSATFFMQGMIDDFVVEDRQQLKKNNALIPATYTLNSSLTFSGLTKSNFNAGLELDMVSTLSYRSKSPQEQWSYAQRGLATNFSDYVRTRGFMTFFMGSQSNLWLEPSLTLNYQGIGDFRRLRSPTTPGGDPIDGILTGTVERTIRPALKLRYQGWSTGLFSPESNTRFTWWFEADAGINFIKNKDNTEGLSDRKFIGLFELFGKISF
ncbi:MAG: hypothetical protein U5J95_00035 [Balneolaceae bacterium]|nr:hypothetical protein [Balneolaceae bacterium]